MLRIAQAHTEQDAHFVILGVVAAVFRKAEHESGNGVLKHGLGDRHIAAHRRTSSAREQRRLATDQVPSNAGVTRPVPVIFWACPEYRLNVYAKYP